MLLMCGDVEANPGPDDLPVVSTLSADVILTTVLATVQRIEQGQISMLSEMKELKEKQKTTDERMQELYSRVVALETKTGNASDVQNEGASNESLSLVHEKLSDIVTRCDDAENRLRRCNLLFFGFSDDSNETWSVSEQKIVNFCAENLGITIVADNIERAHRLGKFATGKNRPIIVKFLRFKDKEQILSSGFKLKNTPFAVREDFSLAVRIARARLLAFAKEKNVPFKLRFDKLKLDNRTYEYNHDTNCITEVR